MLFRLLVVLHSRISRSVRLSVSHGILVCSRLLCQLLDGVLEFTIRSYIEHFDHWIAFGLLLFVGGNMIREAFHKEEEKKQKKDPTKGTTLVMLSVATSIDALAVGLSLSMVNISIWFPAFIIGIVATTFTGIGLHLGKKIGETSHLCSYAEVLGGIVLVGIGLKILSEHNVFSNVM